MKVLRVFALILITANLALADDPFAESNILLSSGCRIPPMAGAFLAASFFSCASMVNPASAATATTRIFRFIFDFALCFASVSHPSTSAGPLAQKEERMVTDEHG